VAATRDSIQRTFDLRPSISNLRPSTSLQPSTFSLRVKGSLCRPCRLQATTRREPRQPILQQDRFTLIDIHDRRNRRAHRRARRLARSTRAKPRSSMTAQRCTSSNYVSIPSCQSCISLRRRVPREIENKRCQGGCPLFRRRLAALRVLAPARNRVSQDGHSATCVATREPVLPRFFFETFCQAAEMAWMEGASGVQAPLRLDNTARADDNCRCRHSGDR